MHQSYSHIVRTHKCTLRRKSGHSFAARRCEISNRSTGQQYVFEEQACGIMHTTYANHLGSRFCWIQKRNWQEKPNVWHLIVVSNTGSPLWEETHTEFEQDFKLLPLWTHSRPYPFCQVHLLLLLWVIHMPHRSNCANPGWRAPTCLLPTLREIGNTKRERPVRYAASRLHPVGQGGENRNSPCSSGSV